MRVKRAPLLGAMIIILLITIIYTNKNTEVKEVDKPLVINEQTVISTNTNTDTNTENINVDTENTDVDTENTDIGTTNTDTIIPTPNPEVQEITPNNNTNLGQFRITAYCSCKKCCGEWSGGPTASGVMPQAGRTISVDPSVIPLGSQVEIDGHIYTAEDTGGAIKGRKIDMYFSSHEEALNYGVQYKNVNIIK